MSEKECEVPISCKICWHNRREEGFCGWEYDENEPKLPYVDTCEEFKFEPLYLIEYLKECEQKDE